MRRAVAAALFCIVALAAAATPARANVGEFMRAARLLNEWRFDEGRREIQRLAKARPRAAETKYLRAELAFLDGDYRGAAALLEGLRDRDVFGHVGELRALVASTIDATEGFARYESDNFVVLYPPGKDEVIVELTAEVLEQARAVIGEDLGYTPAEKIRVEILASPKDLAKVSTLTVEEIETTGTIALCKYNKLMVVTPRATLFGYSWMDTMVHEYVHYVVSRASHDNVPVWLQEGLARFEQTRWRKAPENDLTTIEQHLLRGALEARRLITFDEMHPSMAKLPSQEAAALAFAEVYTMVGFIHAERGFAGLRKVIASIREGRSARRAVAEVMGGRWNQVEGRWKQHLRGLKLARAPQLAGRADRVQFTPRFDPKSGSDPGGELAESLEQADENAGVHRVGNTKAQRFARLGGILRARQLPDAAVIEYEKALAADPHDPFVQGKLARTYLELQRFQDAIRLAAPVMELDEGDAAAATTVGLAHAAQGQHKKAARAFQIALRVQPFDPAVRCGLADVFDRLGDARAARERTACDKLSVVR